MAEMRCPNCGEIGRHFAPPSLGEPGFYTCDPPRPARDGETLSDDYAERFAVFAFSLDGFSSLDERDQQTCRDAREFAHRIAQEETAALRTQRDDALSELTEKRTTVAALRAEVADARADTERLDWLDAEHDRVDPVARLVVKKFHNRHGHEWADCAYSARREIDAARAASGKDAS